MKKGIKQLFILCVGSLAFAMNANAQSFAQGDNVITVGYGFPNLGKSIIKIAEGASDTKATGIGPLHAKYEHAFSDKVGLGVSVGYVAFGAEYTETDYNTGDSYQYKYNVTRLGILARFNYHFANSEKFDPFFGFGAGYNHFQVKDQSDPNAPNGTDEVLTIPINVAFEGSVGARYYFTKNIGAYMEIGFGKSLVQAGIAAKF